MDSALVVWDAINAVFPLAVVLWTAALCTTLYEASAALLLAGLAAVVMVVGVLKVAVGRGRPDRSDARSFPSGHAAVAAFLAAATGTALLLGHPSSHPRDPRDPSGIIKKTDDSPPGWRVGPTLLSIAAAVAATAAGGRTCRGVPAPRQRRRRRLGHRSGRGLGHMAHQEHSNPYELTRRCPGMSGDVRGCP